MVRFKGGVETWSRGQKRKIDRIRDTAGKEEIKQLRERERERESKCTESQHAQQLFAV